MARPLKTRTVRPQDKLAALNAALRHGRMDAAAIAEYCGLSKHSVKSCKFYLPSYGCAESQRYRSWTVLEVLAWLRIPLEQRAEGLASNRVREAVLREYRAHLEQLNLFDLLKKHKIREVLRHDDCIRKAGGRPKGCPRYFSGPQGDARWQKFCAELVL